MMVKLVRLLKRPPTMTADELRTWWLGPHATIAKGIPGLKKYVVSLAVSAPDEEPEYDGMAEMWFDNMDDVRKALGSPVMTEARNDAEGHNFTIVRMTTEEYVVV